MAIGYGELSLSRSADIFERVRLAVIVIGQILVFASFLSLVIFIWRGACPNGFDVCLASQSSLSIVGLFVLAAVRPLFVTPIFVVASLAPSVGPILGGIVVAVGSAVSSLIVFFPARVLGRRFVLPWIERNLPATLALARSHEMKIVIGTRWLPIFPFDLMSAVYGVLGLSPRRVFIGSMVGILSESLAVAILNSGARGGVAFVGKLLTWWGIVVLPLFAYEYIVRRRGGSLWSMTRKMLSEMREEIRFHNGLERALDVKILVPGQKIPGLRFLDKDGRASTRTGTSLDFETKIPVLLLYGFFSSRRALETTERALLSRGYDVLSFNLGGMFGVFNTRDIKDVARDLRDAIDAELQPGAVIDVVAHSKGGLIAMWWILKLGGATRVRRVITMGTPFRGSWLSALAMVSPLGIFWRDVWQMRPASGFLRDLADSVVPHGLEIINMVSRGDRVTGYVSFAPHRIETGGVVRVIDMSDVSHFGFLEDPSVIDRVDSLLRDVDPKCL